MNVDDLANSVVRALAQYLIHQRQSGPVAFNAKLESLLNQLEILLADTYLAETLARFKDAPEDAVRVQTLCLQLAERLREDPEAARALSADLSGAPLPVPKPDRPVNSRILLIGAGVLVVAVLVVWIALSGSTPEAPRADPAPPNTTTSTTTTTTTTTTSSTAPSSASSPPSSFPASAQPGDGGAVPAGSRILVDGLPRPQNQWVFDHGDHDVQLTQFNNSLWGRLNSCYTSQRSAKQEFRLRNFKRLEVPAVGTDGTSDAGMSVKFQVFVNTDQVKPIQEVVAGPGEIKQIAVDLPADVFSVTLQASLVTVDVKNCAQGNAVWGSPHVVAGRN
ncbi:hypothetical protein SK803_34325 [Lentzea sp. BCCO 10_0856]|uniref:NPCBM/NEW2 domain-containing protein n=1 Tax=Lentzea miocenica TaxID=3095431 RepID=A0ABU4TAY0_9PSEU|nr:hypothetical protein [Lentzea sp. BCCO 10_0856]MDX8035314.1 hypothetical protein [Lentzea sp. BCCO 10_0856]